jgi:OPA family glycerol-3-phosphate transporter-like MFS transporter
MATGAGCRHVIVTETRVETAARLVHDVAALMLSFLPRWANDLLPILMLLGVVAVVLWRLPKVELGHSPAFLRRRFWNWFPLGLTYSFLYMGRYNLTVSKNALGDLMTKEDFGNIFAVGTVVYGFAFLLNGPLTDRWGGRATMLIAAVGAAVMNVLMGGLTYLVLAGEVARGDIVPMMSALYAGNMYFQSFGAVSIAKVNAAWFHVRERGTFGGIFGILISLGIYFAFDWGRLIVTNAPTYWVFFVPAVLLLTFAAIDFFAVFDTPSDTGHADIETADASSGEGSGHLPVLQVAYRMFTNPVIIVIAAVEFCSGFLRQAIMHWYPIFAKQTGAGEAFVASNWGMLLCCAGILGGMLAGVISDHVFQSRRGPVSSVLYGGLVAGALLMFATLTTPWIGWVVVGMSLCVIGVHGMLSGTASMDFGGKKNVGVAVGIIDGCVYLGTALQAVLLGNLLPKDGTAAAQDPARWTSWPTAIAPIALLGLVLATRVWNATPQRRSPQATPAATKSAASAPPTPAPERGGAAQGL